MREIVGEAPFVADLGGLGVGLDLHRRDDLTIVQGSFRGGVYFTNYLDHGDYLGIEKQR